jgi:exodeoxyribonuclease VII large subunit
MEELSFSVSEFVEVFNQTLDFAYPSVTIVGELANLRISKNRWVYFDLKDESSSVKFFGTVYKLPGPLEDGMILRVTGQPRLHNLYGFSVNVLNITPSGEGSILKAAALLKAKLTKEGLFDESRKRGIIYPPSKIALITSDQSAAYADFTKIISARWQSISIDLINVQVQGEIAPLQIVRAIEAFNASAEDYDVIVLIRGGGSPEDLAAFSTEQVTRAVAASRVPTLVAIGHEIDISLAELAADVRASTPSNAAELLVPERKSEIRDLSAQKVHLDSLLNNRLEGARVDLVQSSKNLQYSLKQILKQAKLGLKTKLDLLKAYNPEAILSRGYSIVRKQGKVVKNIKQIKAKDLVEVQLYKDKFKAEVKEL